MLLVGAGRVACPCTWPRTSCAVVLCRVLLELLGPCPDKEPLQFATDCRLLVPSEGPDGAASELPLPTGADGQPPVPSGPHGTVGPGGACVASASGSGLE